MTRLCDGAGGVRARAGATHWALAQPSGRVPSLHRGQHQLPWWACAVPSGVALHDPRQQLFDAAERVLVRDGPSA
jgi:hypothetical protein